MRFTAEEIAAWRLRTQRLIGPPLVGPVDVVRHLLGVQAENYGPATWAIGERCTSTTARRTDRLYSDGALLRTHLLRTTWHFVDPSDIAWLCAATRPRLLPIYASQLRNLGIDEETVQRALNVIVESLDTEGPLTRRQLRARLDATSLPMTGNTLTFLTATAEAEGLVCSGPLVAGEHTHDLLDRRAPDARRIDRDEALVELARRYVAGHGPVTEGDLCYWASLTRSQARGALAELGDQISWFEHDDHRYAYAPDSAPCAGSDPEVANSAHLLQILDEMYRGYQESRMVIDHAGLTPPGREGSIGMVLVGGQIAGTMSRVLGADTIAFEVTPYRHLDARSRTLIRDAADRYGRFFERRATVTFA